MGPRDPGRVIVKIAKTFRWEMGHRLPNHPGGCRNLHGHSYRMQVEVSGSPGADGMIMDFDDMTREVRPLIEELDHAFLCQDTDTDLAAFLDAHDMKRKIVPFPSTVENICELFADHLDPVFRVQERVTAFAVTIFETETSSARTDRSCENA